MSEAGFWKEFEKEWDRVNRSAIIVLGDSSLNLSDYKVYIDRYIHGTPTRFAQFAPPNGIYTRVPAGTHSIVVRDYDARKVNRMESNTLQVNVDKDEKITIWVSSRESGLFITQDHAA